MSSTISHKTILRKIIKRCCDYWISKFKEYSSNVHNLTPRKVIWYLITIFCYSVMQSKQNSFVDDVVLDDFKMVFMDEESTLGHIWKFNMFLCIFSMED